MMSKADMEPKIQRQQLNGQIPSSQIECRSLGNLGSLLNLDARVLDISSGKRIMTGNE
jgi:hypothetical protein